MKIRALILALVVCVAGCHHPTSLDGNWGIPPQEGDGPALSREVVLLADNQIQHLYGDPVWLRTGFTNAFVSVAIRAVQLDFYAPDMLEWIAGNFGKRRLLVHLGDALNVACRAEWDVFVARMAVSGRGWVMAPGNHDAFYFGNGDFSRDEWTRACSEQAASVDGSFLKDRFVQAYLRALASHEARGVPGFHFELPAEVPEEGSWRSAPGQDAILTGVAWRIDRKKPWRSFVAQRLDLRLPGQPQPVVAVLIDTSHYTLRPGLLPIYPWRNSGITGSLRSDQIDAVTAWLEEAPDGAPKVVMGHHPYESLTRGTRRALDGWRQSQGVGLYVSAHTHTAQYFVHRDGKKSWLELNIGSTTDWPPEFRTLAIHEDTRYPERAAYRLQRFPLHRIWDEEQVPDCDPAWEVPPERKDFYVAYDELITPSPRETQKALMDTLLRSHAWLLDFVPSSSANATWPSGTGSDAEVLDAIDDRLASDNLSGKLAFLRELDAFERSRTVESETTRTNFHLCQARWASKYDLQGRRAPVVDDSYIVLPKE